MNLTANTPTEVKKESKMDSLIKCFMMSIDSISVSKNRLEHVNLKLNRPLEDNCCGQTKEGIAWDKMTVIEKLDAINGRLASLSESLSEEVSKLNEVI